MTSTSVHEPAGIRDETLVIHLLLFDALIAHYPNDVRVSAGSIGCDDPAVGEPYGCLGDGFFHSLSLVMYLRRSSISWTKALAVFSL